MNQLDGTPDGDYRARLKALAAEFAVEGVELARLERAVLKLRIPIARASRSSRHLTEFTEALKRWERVKPVQDAVRKAAVLADDRGDVLQPEVAADLWRVATLLNRERPPHYAPDARGSYAWATSELKAAAKKARPKKRRRDTATTQILNVVRTEILFQLQPETENRMQHGLKTKAAQLTERYVKFRFPTLLSDATADRIRRRPSLTSRSSLQNRRTHGRYS